MNDAKISVITDGEFFYVKRVTPSGRPKRSWFIEVFWSSADNVEVLAEFYYAPRYRWDPYVDESDLDEFVGRYPTKESAIEAYERWLKQENPQTVCKLATGGNP